MIRCTPALILFAAIPLIAAESWQSLLTEGNAARSAGDYATSHKLLQEACNEAQRTGEGSVVFATCNPAFHEFAIRGEYRQAQRTAQLIVDALAQGDDPDLLASAHYDLAEIAASRGKLTDALNELRRTVPLLPSVRPATRVRILALVGQFYMAIGNAEAGTPLLTTALVEVGQLDATSVSDLEAAIVLAEGLIAWDGAVDICPPIACLLDEGVDHAREASDLSPVWISTLTDLNDTLARAARKSGDWKTASRANMQLETVLVPLRAQGKAPSKAAGKGIARPGLVKRVEPIYTVGAKQAGAEGHVILRIEIWPDGRTHNIQVARRLPYGLSWRAIDAVRQWRFEPAERNGQPIKVRANVDVNFRLR